LIGFVFTDESGSKRRPAVVVSSTEYHRRRNEVIVAAVTSNPRRRLFADHSIRDWKAAGLLFPSLVTGILRTVKRQMLQRRLGRLSIRDAAGVDHQIRRALGFESGGEKLQANVLTPAGRSGPPS
jgi:mRNA interferase MazF